MTTVDVGVVGAGIHGAAAAYHLARRGASVAIVERTFPAGGPTGCSSAICRAYYTDRFLATCARKYGRVPKTLAPDATACLLHDRWLGNVRELAHVIERATLMVDGDVVANISILEDRSRFLAVMQGGIIKAGRLANSPADRNS